MHRSIELLVLVLVYVLVGSIHAETAHPIQFREEAEASGVDFVHRNGMEGKLWLVEILGAGAAVLDFDQDGLLDIWLVQGGQLRADQSDFPKARDRIFKNVTQQGTLRFEDITEKTGVRAQEYGMGIATGDIDNDGDLDVFLANFGPNQLFENEGDGRFEEITAESGIRGDRWSVAGSFTDFDNDGLLDLYVVNYVEFTLATHKQCFGISPKPDYCAPTAYPPTPDRLYRGVGGGKFVDVSKVTKIDSMSGGGLGVIAADFDDDQWVDWYVANDPTRNFLWMNDGGIGFEELAMQKGVAANADGKTEASMGIDVFDFDQDCDNDIFITNLVAESNTLYVSRERNYFSDRTNSLGLGLSSHPYTGFGTKWLDIELDGDADLVSFNGAVSIITEQQTSGEDLPLRQKNQVWMNVEGAYVEVDGGPAFQLVEVSRGAAFGDLDNDGDTDIVVTNNGGPVRIYRNDTLSLNWVGVDLRRTGMHITGTMVYLENEPCSRRMVRTDGSYASASDTRVVFGLGNRTKPQRVAVEWRGGEKESFGPLQLNQYHILRMGEGTGVYGNPVDGKNSETEIDLR